VPLAIPIVILLALLVSMGYAATARSVAGGFASWMPGWLKKAAFFALPLADQVIRLTKYLTHELGTHFAAIEAQGVKWFHDLAHYVDVVGYWSLYWPVGLFHEVVHLTTVTIPRMIHAKTAPIQRQADAAEAQAKAAAGVAHSFPKVAKANSHVPELTRVERVAMPHAGEWDWLHRHWKGVRNAVLGAVAVAGALTHPGSIPWENPFSEWVKQNKKRLSRLELLLGATGAAALVARALGGVTVNCVRKGNIGKVARRLCGLDGALVDLLLLETTLIVGAVSVVEFAEALLVIEDEALKIAHTLIKEFPDPAKLA
jgi:hypothetical protein